MERIAGLRRRRAAFIFSILLFFTVSLLLLITLIRENRTSMDDELQQAISIEIQQISSSLEQVFRGIRSNLVSVSEAYKYGLRELTDLSIWLNDIADSRADLLRTILIVNDRGIVIAESRFERSALGFDVSDRDYFLAHRDGNADQAVFLQSVVSRVNGEWSMPVSKGIYSSNGVFLGVAVASLEPRYVSRILERISNPRFGGKIVLHSRESVLTSLPYDREILGRSMNEIRPQSAHPEDDRFAAEHQLDLPFPLVFTYVPDRYDYSHIGFDLAAGLTVIVIVVSLLSFLAYLDTRNQERLARYAAELEGRDRAQKILLTELQKALADRDILLREISHRTQNSMAIIAAVLNLKAARHEGNSAVGELVSDTEKRIQALSMVYALTDNQVSGGAVNIKRFLKKLASHVSIAYGSSECRVVVAVQSPAILLPIDQAVPLSLVLHELIINSIQHGFTGRSSGSIDISISRSSGALTCDYRDDGRGFENPEAEVKGIGLSTIYQIIELQLDGSYDFIDGKGVHLRVTFPLNAQVTIKAEGEGQ